MADLPVACSLDPGALAARREGLLSELVSLELAGPAGTREFLSSLFES